MHILIREAAYHGLLKRTRPTSMSASSTGWNAWPPIACSSSRRSAAITWSRRSSHCSSSHRTTSRSGRSACAGAVTSSAGRRALARGDIPAAANLLQRAATLLPPGHAERPRLRLDAAEALTEQGGFEEAGAMLHAAIDEAHELSDRVLEATAQIQELEPSTPSTRKRWNRRSSPASKSISCELEALEAHDGLARAWRLIMFVREMGLAVGTVGAARSARSSTRPPATA